MRGPGADDVEVEIVDEPGAAGPRGLRTTPAADDGSPRAGERTARPPRRRPLALGGAAVVLVTAVVLAQVAENADSVTEGVPDRAASMPDAPVELWHVSDVAWSEPEGDLLVTAGRDAPLAAYDLLTGAVVWTRDEHSPGECWPAPRADADAEPLRIACVGGLELTADGVLVLRLTVRAGDDGRVLWTHELPADRWAAWLGTDVDDPAPRDLFWAARAGSSITVVRLDGATGEPVWSTEHLAPDTAELFVDVVDDVVTVGGEVVLDRATGRVSDGPEPGADVWEARLSGDATAVVRSRPNAPPASIQDPASLTTTVRAADGTERFTVPGVPLVGGAAVSDLSTVLGISGPAGEVLLDAATGEEIERVTVLDVVTGEELWHTDARSALVPVAYLRDRVVVARDGELVAFVARTGVELWSVRTRDGLTGTPFWAWRGVPVDDTRVVIGREVDHRSTLAAVDLATGDVAWELDLATPVSPVRSRGEVLVVDTAERVVVLGRPPAPDRGSRAGS